jgi:hypothetical protein
VYFIRLVMTLPAPCAHKLRQNLLASHFDGIYDVAKACKYTLSSAYIELTSPTMGSAWPALLQRQDTVLQ